MRLDKFISQATGISRKNAKREIALGLVTVDGITVTDPATHADVSSNIMVSGARINLPGFAYLVMHKPRGVICATRDRHDVTVTSLLDQRFAGRVHPVGRLDKDTTGLLLLTDDGAWTHAITSPQRHRPKRYIAQLADTATTAQINQLENGVLLRGESCPTRPAGVEVLAANKIALTITEGRYHQVRRMLAAVGNRVIALHRTHIGKFCLPGDLDPGEWREMTDTEFKQI